MKMLRSLALIGLMLVGSVSYASDEAREAEIAKYTNILVDYITYVIETGNFNTITVSHSRIAGSIEDDLGAKKAHQQIARYNCEVQIIWFDEAIAIEDKITRIMELSRQYALDWKKCLEYADLGN